jgi:DNA repair photolyase
MVAPVIPALNDSEIESILKAASAAGAESAGYVLLRLPLEVRDIFREWLMKEMPDRASHVMSLVRSMRQGKDYDAAWGRRMKGTGPYAWSIGRRFELACTKLKLNQQKTRLEPAKFRPPVMKGQQLPLF